MNGDRLVRTAAGEIVDRYGADVVPVIRERAEAAKSLGDEIAAETWRKIADAAEAEITRREARE
jgi:hypothetical protein